MGTYVVLVPLGVISAIVVGVLMLLGLTLFQALVVTLLTWIVLGQIR